MNEWSMDPYLNRHFLASARTVSSISPFYSKRETEGRECWNCSKGERKSIKM